MSLYAALLIMWIFVGGAFFYGALSPLETNNFKSKLHLAVAVMLGGPIVMVHLAFLAGVDLSLNFKERVRSTFLVDRSPPFN